MSHLNQFLWVIFPYFMLGSFFFGTYLRFTKKYRWNITAKSSELLEKKQLMVGSVLFHVGLIFVFMGHVMGILIPKAVLTFLEYLIICITPLPLLWVEFLVLFFWQGV